MPGCGMHGRPKLVEKARYNSFITALLRLDVSEIASSLIDRSV